MTQKEYAEHIYNSGNRKISVLLVMSFFIGILYVIMGLMINHGSFSFLQPRTFFGTGFFLIIIAGFLLNKKRDLRCHHCGKRFNPDSVLASGWCPECHNPLFKRETLKGLSFTRNFRSEDAAIALYLIFIFILQLFGGTIWIITHAHYSSFISFGIFFISEGILFMLMPLTRLCRFIRLKNACPVCGGLRNPVALQLTGNCSCCGSPANDWSAPLEDDPIEDLPPFSEVIKWKKHRLWKFFLPKNLHVLRRCPYCKRESDKKPWWKRSYCEASQAYTFTILKYERCPVCRRKLFR